MNWGEVKALAAGFMHRKNLASRFDACQALVMADLTKALDVAENEAAASFAMTASAVLAGLYESPLPPDFGRPKSFQIGNQSPLEASTLINMQGNNRRDQYCIVGRKVMTRNASPMVGVYGGRVLPVSNDASSNVFLEFHPTACAYSLLVHACNSIQDFDAAPNYQAQLDRAIETANVDAAWARMGAGSAPQSGYANP